MGAWTQFIWIKTWQVAQLWEQSNERLGPIQQGSPLLTEKIC